MNGNVEYSQNYSRQITNRIQQFDQYEFLQGYVNYIHNLSWSTKYSYLNYVINYMEYTKKSPETLIFDDYINYLSTLGDRTPSYQIAVYAALKKLSTYFTMCQYAKKDYMKYIDRPKFKESEETRKKRDKGYLESNEITAYLNSVQRGTGSKRAIARQEKWKNRDELIIMLFLNTGMRCSALYKLDLDDIDYTSQKLYVTDKNGVVTDYALSNSLMELIQDWVQDRKLLLNNKQVEALFISNERTRLSTKSISRIIEKYAKSIPDKKITPHKLRATFGTQLYKKTGDIYLVQECMGHSSPKITKTYIRGQKNTMKVKARDIMSDLTKI